MELRPLGFGEIFDRAVTLYIKNIVPFAAIVFVWVVPLAVLTFIEDLGSQPSFDMMVWVLEHPGRVRPMPSTFESPLSLIALGAIALLAWLFAPFVMNAVAVGVARCYRGRPVEFRACYEAVLRRWPQILGLIGIEMLIFVGWYFAVLAVALIIVFLVAGIASYAPRVGFWIGFIVGLLALLALLPALAPLFIALSFGMYATVIEERPVVESVLLGFARVFNRREFWRSVLFAVASAAIVFGASTIFSFLALLAAFAHLPLVEAIVSVIPSAVVSPFGAVLLAVYYFDVRIRQEGYDLEAGLERLATAQPA